MMWPFTQPTSKLEYQVATEADLADGDRAVRRRRRPLPARRVRRHRAARRPRLPDRRVPHAVDEHPHRRLGRDVENRARLLLEIDPRAARPPRRRDPALDPHQRDRAPQDRRRASSTSSCRSSSWPSREGIDAVHVTAYASTDVATGPTDGYAPHTYEAGRPGSLTEYASVVRAAVGVPVITFGRIEPDEAEAGARRRARPTSSRWAASCSPIPTCPTSLREGRVDDIRPCIYQYRCIGNIFVKESLHCVAQRADRPRARPRGRRRARARGTCWWSAAGRAGSKRRDCSRRRATGSRCGTRASELGGTLRYAGRADPLLERYRGWLIRQVEQAGVDARARRAGRRRRTCGRSAPTRSSSPPARGGRSPTSPAPTSVMCARVPEIAEWLARRRRLRRRSASSCSAAGKPGISIADLCIRAWARRSRCSSRPTCSAASSACPAGGGSSPTSNAPAHAWSTSAAVSIDLARRRCTVRVGDDDRAIPADTVIVTAPRVPDHTLADALRSAGLSVHTVGDCDGVRSIEGANLDAAHVALAIG